MFQCEYETKCTVRYRLNIVYETDKKPVEF